MKLYTSSRTPNPRRVDMFMAEKGISGIERVEIDLNGQQHKAEDFRRKNPVARVPVLELDDGRLLPESRAICGYLEGQQPEPNLCGRDATERAFIEAADRQVEFTLLLTIANAVRHGHPGLASLESPQFPEFALSQLGKLTDNARWLDEKLATQPYVAGERFTIADITAFCAIEFAKLLKWRPANAGLTHLAAWRDRVAERPSAKA